MQKFIAFVSPKGGCGATFSCAGVWNALAKEGYRVLAVDFGGRKSALDFALGFQNDSVYNVTDVIDGTCQINDALCVSNEFENAFFLRGDTLSDDLDFQKFKSKVSGFDYVLLDFSYMGDDENIALSDKIILVTDGTEVSARMCEAFSKNFDWDKLSVIVNKIIPSYIKNGFMPTVDEILSTIGAKPIGLIPWSPDVCVMSANADRNKLCDKYLLDAFSNIAMRICEKDVPAIDFNMNYECFRIKKRR